MILIITHKKDYTADFLINKLNEAGISYYRLNCEDLLNKPFYQIKSESGFKLCLDVNREISSVWYRRTQVPDLANLGLAQQLYFYREFDALLENLYHSLNNYKWLSNPFAIKKAESKVYQLQIAQKLGFDIPRTLITNSKKELNLFFASCTSMIIKPLYSGYVPQGNETALFFTSVVTKEHITDLGNFDLTPCLYQEYVNKAYELRVTVVNGNTFSAKIESQKNPITTVDWRKADDEFTVYELPLTISEKCVALCQELGIQFGAIDMIRTTTGEYIFLEINPNGQWAWIEMQTGLSISKAIINYLS